MFTFNVIKSGKNLPIIYALLPNKLQKTYEKMLNMLSSFFTSSPSTVGMDFEKAIMNSFSAEFDADGKPLKIGGCYFHFCQNMWKHFASYGLSTDYDKDERTSQRTNRKRTSYRSFRCILGLAFIPAAHVITAFGNIVSQMEENFRPMTAYFEEYYIGLLKPNGRRAVPLFPIASWSCYDRVLNGEAIVSNSLESWHKQFENDCGERPTLAHLIERFQIEQGFGSK